MPEDVAQWVRVHAARHGMSVSRMISSLVEHLMQESQGYEAAMRRYLSRKRGRLGGTRPQREELYDRGNATWARKR
jgi:hypothetical protein